MDVDLRERVATERMYRGGMSIREASVAGSISNTTWSKWEAGSSELTNKLAAAIARAFDWPADWPSNPPPIQTISQLDDLERKVDRLTVLVLELSKRLLDGDDDVQP